MAPRLLEVTAKFQRKSITKRKGYLYIRHQQIPVRYKRNSIKDELHKSNNVAYNFVIEIKRIAARFPTRFLRSIIDNLNDREDDLIIHYQLIVSENKVKT